MTGLSHVRLNSTVTLRVQNVTATAYSGSTLVYLLTEEATTKLPLTDTQRVDFSGQRLVFLPLYSLPGFKAERILLVGLGPEKKADARVFRSAITAAVKHLKQFRLESSGWAYPASVAGLSDDSSALVASSILLADYAFDAFVTKDTPHFHLHSVNLLTTIPATTVEEAVALANSTCLTRDLVNTRADLATPETLAAFAVDLASKLPNTKARVVTYDEMGELGMGLIRAVGQGAVEKPQIVCLHYEGAPGVKQCLALVGKGICFDTGGLNLKGTGAMEDMHLDKGGACAVLGALHAVATQQLPVNVVVALAIAENAIGPESCKPWEILRSYKGLTVLNANTDFEGRLVLADTMTYVQREYTPDQMITLATLTGAIITALGYYAAGMFTTSDAMAAALSEASVPGDERVWRMPLYPEYSDELQETMCDLRSGVINSIRAGGSAIGATFLSHFVEEGVDYVHLDMAGPCGVYASDVRPWIPHGATGWGPNLLYHYVKHHRCGANP